jgi:hypothetical protein
MMLMVLSLASLNMPYVAVFCIGNDGHMAIELVGHGHCTDGSHSRDHHTTGSEAAEHSHVGRPHCRPCIDIPIPVESSDRRFASQRSRITPAHAAGLAPAVEIPWLAEGIHSVERSCFFSPLLCGIPSQYVILQV